MASIVIGNLDDMSSGIKSGKQGIRGGRSAIDGIKERSCSSLYAVDLNTSVGFCAVLRDYGAVQSGYTPRGIGDGEIEYPGKIIGIGDPHPMITRT